MRIAEVCGGPAKEAGSETKNKALSSLTENVMNNRHIINDKDC